VNLGTATILRADSRHLPLADDSVDLVVSSPPYWSLRSYQDGGSHYSGQLGSEATPREFVDSLIEVTRELVRVTKPSGSIWINLGDKYNAYNGGRGPGTIQDNEPRQNVPRGNGLDVKGVRPKSLIGIPWRYALACIDDLGLILRAEVIWSKPNGLPESVTDRVRRSHETWFHFTLNQRYFSAVDGIREPHAAEYNGRPSWDERKALGQPMRHGDTGGGASLGVPTALASSPLGKLPGSVWTVPTEPLRVPESLGIDHFAAFPTEFPKRIIQGWSPAGVCVECGEGRRPVVDVAMEPLGMSRKVAGGGRHDLTGQNERGMNGDHMRTRSSATITGYSCACPEPTADTTPAVILDAFGGTGTTAMVAKALGRHGISVDMSADYCRLAEWRTNDRNQLAKVLGVAKVDAVADDEQSLFDLLDGGAA
jgi:DNA modification methylase